MRLVKGGVTRPKLIINSLEGTHKEQQKFLKEADPNHVEALFDPTRQLSIDRIKNFLSYEKKEGPALELGELSQWCKDNSNVPVDRGYQL